MPRFASIDSSSSSGGGGSPSYFYNPSGTFGTCVTFYTQSGCFVVPTGITSVRARVWGAGGGGGTTAAGAGGGGGGFALRTITGLTPGTCIPVTIGAFGPGVAGGTSSFGSFVSATGGACNGGTALSLGGTGLCGDINRCGGCSCNTNGCAAGGGGSGNYFGNGGCFTTNVAPSGISGSGAMFGTVPCSPGGNGLTGVGSICCCNASSASAVLYPTWTYLDYYGTGPGGGGCACGFNGGGNGARCSCNGFGGSPNPLDNVTGLVIVEF